MDLKIIKEFLIIEKTKVEEKGIEIIFYENDFDVKSLSIDMANENYSSCFNIWENYQMEWNLIHNLTYEHQVRYFEACTKETFELEFFNLVRIINGEKSFP